jgi:uncharacterized protein (DUF433 family)
VGAGKEEHIQPQETYASRDIQDMECAATPLDICSNYNGSEGKYIVRSTQAHIAVRTVEQTEAYLPGTGLTVWEVAWIAREHDGEMDAIVRHLGIDCSLVQEALDYAAEHHAEIEQQIHDHVSWSMDEIKRLLPQARGVCIDSGSVSGSAP